MRSVRATLRRALPLAIVPTLIAGGLALTVAIAPIALADAPLPTPAAVQQIDSTNVTADALPTVQIDGVVWGQAINPTTSTVYAGGKFQNARPAGAAPGASLTPRSNLLSYNLTTGVLNTSFAPSLNGQVLAVALTPDGTKLFVGGDFTTADGATTHGRIAEYNTSTGALVSSFTGSVNSSVTSIATTNTTVYIGGNFTSVNGVARNHLAAFTISSGALANWKPSADGLVKALVVTPDGTMVIAGGQFQNVNGATANGLAALSVSTGSLQPWAAGNTIYNSGKNAGITSLSTDGNAIYGTGYVFGSITDGDLEGTFSASPNTGAINWVEDCHGDTYDSWSNGTTVYTVSHAHYCATLGGMPQTNPFSGNMRHSLAFTAGVKGLLDHSAYGNPYKDWYGTPSPALLNWFPDLSVGSYTGQSQAAWTVTGANGYVVQGGEFPAVNGTPQQGLVRFATKAITTPKQGPRIIGANFVPSVVSLNPGTVRVAWTSNWDRDDLNLSYKVIRNSDTAHPVYTITSASEFWNLPVLGFIDTGLTPGQTYTYKLVASDNVGGTGNTNTVTGNPVSITVASGSGTSSQYAKDVIADGAMNYWRLGEAAGSTGVSYDYVNYSDLTINSGVTRGAGGAIIGDSDLASTFDGSTGLAATTSAVPGPNNFTIEAWFNTTSTSGGKIVGFGDQSSGLSNNFDRHVYMDASGRVNFGVYNNGGYVITSPNAYNDGKWHQVVASLSNVGLVFYVDGRRVGTNAGTTVGQSYSGYWRVGGDNSWSGSNYFTGTIDDVAIYPSALPLATVQKHYTDSGRTPLGATPTDAYGKAVIADSPALYYRLDEPSGAAAIDYSGNGDDGIYYGGSATAETYGVTSPVTNTGDTAVTFDGAAGSNAASSQSFNNPTVYAEELWFNTTTTNGGKLIGFGSNQSGASGSYDRHVYMENSGQLTFGTYNGNVNTTTSSASYNDGKWHYLAATQDGGGMKLYVDGQLVGTNPHADAQSYSGYWRIGGDNLSGWSNGSYFAGSIDEAAVYSTALNQAQISAHYSASPAHNVAPVASIALTSNLLTVKASGAGSTDPDGSIAGYAWNFGDGVTATGSAPSHTYGAAGTYTVTLTVTDNGGLTNTTTQSITVSAQLSPTAAFTATPTGLSVAFDGTGSAPSAGATLPTTGYAWNFGDGSTGSGATTSHPYSAGGTYTVTLTVTDSGGGSNTASHTVTVHQPPLAAFTPTGSGLAVAFDSSASKGYDGATLANYSWAFGDGGTSTAPSPSHTYTSAGSYTVTLTITDSSAATGTISQTVVTSHQAPQGAFTSSTSATNTLAVAFDSTGTATSDGATISSYSWAFGDGTNSIATSPSHIYTAAGTYPVTLTVTDSLGASSSVTHSVALTHQAPVASFTSTTNLLTATFNSSGSAAFDGASISGYSWNFGDNGTSTSANPVYTYAAEGTYPVTLTVTDTQGSSTTSSVGSVTVAAHKAPTVTFKSTATGLAVAFDSTGTATSDGATISSYSWNFGDSSAPGTGAAPSHTYAAAGTYPVTLTVADSLNSSNTTTNSVTLTSVVTYATDIFSRAATSKWGNADLGGAWTLPGALSAFSVDGNVGRINMASAGSGPQAYLNSVSAINSNSVVDLGLSAVATGGGTYISLGARHTGTSDYRVKVQIKAGGSMSLLLTKVVSGSETTLKTVNITGVIYNPGDTLRMRLIVTGSGTTSLSGSIWKVGTTEPTVPTITTTDTTASLQSAGGVAVQAYLSGTSTNAPVTASFDNLSVVSPQ